jgi:glutamyl-Q tRNA(Asp) synthetase
VTTTLSPALSQGRGGYTGRFAPSPTGPLHFGSLVAAVASWLDARARGGRWLLRIEDVDAPRTVPGAADSIMNTLEALGLTWDGAVSWQSDQAARYEEALTRLRAKGLVYRCRCSRKEVADSGLRGIEGAIYPGTCRALGLDPATEGADRFVVPPGTIRFDDRAQGPVEQDVAGQVGDFVLKRRDGLHAYQLAVVADDAAEGVTDVVRGADLLLSTPRQILLQRALGFATPRYFHFPVATNARGEKLSKQTRAPAIDPARPQPALGEALQFLGQEAPGAGQPAEMLAEAMVRWDPARVPRGLGRIIHNSF